jgi:hypothetical protein
VREKGRGSLGMGSLQGKNKALLFKWLWRLGDQNRGGWQDIIIRNYQPIFKKDFLFSINRFQTHGSSIYSIIHNEGQVSPSLKNYLYYTVGNEKKVQFRTNSWLENGSLKLQFP